MTELLFKPIGMERTTPRPLMAMTYPFASPHAPVQGQPKIVRPFFNNVAMWPAGSTLDFKTRYAEGVGEFQPKGCSNPGYTWKLEINAESVRPGLTLSGLHDSVLVPGLLLRSNRWAGISQRLRRISSGLKLTHHLRR